MLAEGLVLSGIEFGLGGDTSKYPSPWELIGNIINGIYDAYNTNGKCQRSH